MDPFEPQVGVEPLYIKKAEGRAGWLITWRIQNFTADEITIVSARFPHSQFRGGEKNFSSGLLLPPKGTVEMVLAADFREPPGAVVENAFLILLLEYRRSQWRVFARFRVTANHRGQPEPVVERVTAQRVGFSGISK